MTQYETGELTIAEREKSWHSWGPPLACIAEPEYDYKTRRIEDVLSGWSGL